VGLSVVAVFLLLVGGLDPLDAVVHAMTSVATGGFSNYDASVGWFRSGYVEGVLFVMMVLGSLTFPLMILVFHGRPLAIWRDEQVRFYLMLILAVTALMVLWRVRYGGVRIEEAVWPTLFNVVSVLTTTGYASDNYVAWGAFPETLFFLVMMIGGCTGSTAGGIKPYRLLVLGKMMRNQILTRLQPHRILRITYNDRVVDDEIVRSVSAYVWMILLSFLVFTGAVSATGIDFSTSIAAVAATLSNVGPGIGPVVGPAGNFATIPELALWILSAAMLLGRLEVVVVLVVLSPTFWRQ
jgi:trk system potassium uptake protein